MGSETTSPVAPPRPERRRVVIAGAGVAGLEALLALSELARDHVELVLLAPADEFVYRPLLVTEPFGGTGAVRIGLSPIVEGTGAEHIREALVSVDPAARSVRTSAGRELRYDWLLVALGARPVEAVPGALTFGTEAGGRELGDLLARLGRRGTKRLAFVVPPAVTWSLAAYELALLTAAERTARRLARVEISLVTHEDAPLDLFGAAASALVAARLAEADVALHPQHRALRFADRRLEFAQGDPLDADAVVALPKLTGVGPAGLPRTRDGFLRTDAQMHVSGLEDVWAAGDATAFPVKQGGLAAQQAAVAARTIAAKAGAHVPFEPFQPVLRAALITGGPVEYMRTAIHERDSSEVSEGHALWSPAAKVAGRYLATYLAPAFGTESPPELVDLGAGEAPAGDADEGPQSPDVLLAAADADARLGDYEGALAWLGLVEKLDFVIPPDYLPRRQEWRRRVEPAAARDPAAERVDPGLAGATEAISDLQRRLGWLRELERREGGEMGDHLSRLTKGIEDLVVRSRRTGILGRGDARDRADEDG